MQFYHEKILNKIWNQVPPNYYQKGIKHNILQKRWHENKLKTILSLIDGEPLSILEVGCASGWLLSQIAIKYPQAKIYGIDVYQKAIDFGKKQYPQIKFICADGHKIPFKVNSFDVVICAEVLEHVVDPNLVIQEIKRVMKKNGKGIIEMDTGNFLFNLIWFCWTKIFDSVWKNAHLHIYNKKKLMNQIVKNGLIIAKISEFNLQMAVAFLIKKTCW